MTDTIKAFSRLVEQTESAVAKAESSKTALDYNNANVLLAQCVQELYASTHQTLEATGK